MKSVLSSFTIFRVRQSVSDHETLNHSKQPEPPMHDSHRVYRAAVAAVTEIARSPAVAARSAVRVNIQPHSLSSLSNPGEHSGTTHAGPKFS